MSPKQKQIILLGIISFILLCIIIKWGDYLSNHLYISTTTIIEKFSNYVDMPLTNTNSCKNFCGPNSRCAISKQQCFTDTDCYGCQKTKSSPSFSQNISGENNSTLTNGYGTKEHIIRNNFSEKPPTPTLGANIWFSQNLAEKMLFNKRYGLAPSTQQQDVSDNSKRYSLTGAFTDDGPLPSNY